MTEEREGPAPDDRDDVARLVRLAGKRRAVPQERAARVREVARQSWRQEVGRRTRIRRTWVMALGAAAVVVIGIAWRVAAVRPVDPGASVVALVERLDGGAWSRAGNGETVTLGVGAALRAGSELTTADDGRAAMRLTDGHSIRLDRNTHVHLLDAHSLVVERGAVYVASALGTGSGSTIRLRTPLGEIEEIGTQFEARLSPESLRVRLREGKVIVRQADRSHAVESGTELELHASGSAERKTIATHGTEWAWVADITPMPDFAGRSAREFLDWMAREGGWTLAFSEPAVARSAEGIVLGGTPRRLSLEDALDAVLPTCRMTWRLEEGVLHVAAAPDES